MTNKELNYKQELIELLKSDQKVKELYEGQEDLFCSFLIANGTNHLAKIDKKLQERFIRMFLENKNITGEFCGDKFVIIYKTPNIKVRSIIIDNTEDFDNQSQEVYKEIFLTFKEITNG